MVGEEGSSLPRKMVMEMERVEGEEGSGGQQAQLWKGWRKSFLLFGDLMLQLDRVEIDIN